MKKIGILLCDTANPFWREKIVHYRGLAASFGFDALLRAAGDPLDPEEQCRELQRMAEESRDDAGRGERGYAAVVVNPLTDANLLPALHRLPFPVFDAGPKCDPERTAGIGNYFPVPVADFEEQGFLAGEALISGTEPAGDGWALILGGFCDARQSAMRCRGAFKAFRERFAREHIVTAYADFDGEHAFRTVKELASKLDFQAVFCANDLMALGAVRALRESRPESAVPVAGVDAIPEALQALEDGDPFRSRLFCTVGLPHEEVVRGVYSTVSEWFKGVPPSRKPLVRSVLAKKS